MESEILITKIKTRPSEIDPYRIVHHACYFSWMVLCQKEYLDTHMQDWLDEENWSKDVGVCTYFNCKYIHSAEEGMELLIQTNLKKVKEEESGSWLSFKHQITEEKTNQIIARLETEMFFQATRLSNG